MLISSIEINDFGRWKVSLSAATHQEMWLGLSFGHDDAGRWGLSLTLPGEGLTVRGLRFAVFGFWGFTNHNGLLKMIMMIYI